MQEEMDKGKIKRITIDQKKLNTLSAELNEIAENLQNKIVIEKNVALSKNSITGDFKSWKESKKIEQTNLKKNVDSQIIKSKEILNNALIDAIKQINESGEEITAEQIKEFKGIKIFKTANNALELTSKQVIKDFRTDVVNVYKLRNQEPLFDAIMKQSNKGIEEGIKIAYKNGRQYSFRSYMEMNVRTTVRQEANEFLFKASRSNGVVFYLSNYFADSADDHSAYQNKYYYDKNWKSFGYDEETTKKIEKAISKYHMISYQDVTEKPPYLTTRPNCRHILKPVLLDDVFSKTPKQAGEDYGMRKGTYKSSNYKDLQTQRLNERNIRKYKARLENDLKMQQHMKSPQMSAQIEQDKRLIKYWQDRQRKLLAKNSVLKRDYRRENPKIVVFDAGARYNKGIVKPTTPKTPTEATKEPTPSVKAEPKVKKPILPKEKPLTQEQKDAAEYYVSGDGMWINNVLRGKTLESLEAQTLNEEEKIYLKNLDIVTNSQEVKQKKLYRSVDIDAIMENTSQFDYENLESAIIYDGKDKYSQKMLDRVQKVIGKEITDKGFLSTTKDKTIAASWNGMTGSNKEVVIEFNVPEGIKGYDMKDFEVEDNPQKEILLARNQTYKIEDIKKEVVEFDDGEGGKFKQSYICVVANLLKN